MYLVQVQYTCIQYEIKHRLWTNVLTCSARSPVQAPLYHSISSSVERTFINCTTCTCRGVPSIWPLKRHMYMIHIQYSNDLTVYERMLITIAIIRFKFLIVKKVDCSHCCSLSHCTAVATQNCLTCGAVL